MKSNIKRVMFLLLAAFLGSCVKSPLDSDSDINSNGKLNVRVSTKGVIGSQVGGTSGTDNVTLQDIRLIVFADDKIIINQSTSSGLVEQNDGEFMLKLTAGYYTICAVANETEQMRSELEAARDRASLENIKIVGSFSESDVPLYREYQVVVYGSSDGSNDASVSIDGGTTRTSKLNIDLERTQTKVSLMLRKQTGNSSEVVVNKVEIYNVPTYSYLLPKVNPSADMKVLVPIEGVSISLGADATEENYIPIFEENNIFSEKLLVNATDQAVAAYLKIYATFSGVNTTYEIKLDELSGDYNLLRNVHYVVQGSVKSSGKLDPASITIQPRNWDDINVDADINGNRILNISRIEAMVHGASVTRVHFWSNQPNVWIDNRQTFQSRSDNPRVIDVANPWKDSGVDIAVNNVFKSLAMDDPLNASNAPVNFHYDRNTGKGYFDVENASTNNPGALINKLYHVYLCAASEFTINTPLRRSVLLKSIVESNSYPAVESVTTPYVGVFHRGNQKGERIITWNDNTNWTAVIETDTYIDEDNNEYEDYRHVLIDRQISPALEAGLLYTENPGDAEDYPVSDWSDDMGGVDGGRRWISGTTKVYLRIGWDSYAPGAPFQGISLGADIPRGASYRNRYAKMTIRRGLNAPNGTVIATLYLRQGELSDYIMTPANDPYIDLANDPNFSRWTIRETGEYSVTGGYTNVNYRDHACRISPYNLSDPQKGSGGTLDTDHNLLQPRGAVFTDFPTQAGYLFKFSETLRAYNPSNPGSTSFISGFTIGYKEKVDWNPATMESSPPGYRRPAEHYTQTSSKYDYTKSEFTHTLFEQPGANKLYNDGNIIDRSGLINSKQGWYADGFFDRRKITKSDVPFGGTATENSDTKVSDGATIAYFGTLFFNKRTRTSVFFPHTGERIGDMTPSQAGQLGWPGRSAMYWSDSQFEDKANESSYAWGLDFWVSSYNGRFAVTNQGSKSRAMPVRCVVDTPINRR